MADKHYFRYSDEALCYENKFLSPAEIAKISVKIGTVCRHRRQGELLCEIA
jgi:hypothetical protein